MRKTLLLFALIFSSYAFGTTLTENTVVPPILNGIPSDIIVECDNIPPEPIIGVDITATDGCNNDPNITIVFTETTGNGCPYIITRTWTATDVCQNITEATQIITVEDIMEPIFNNVPNDITVDCNQIPSIPNVMATDNCDPNVTVTFDETIGSGCPYHIVRTWMATDNCGNQTVQSQIITVEDYTTPILSNIPADATVECDAVPFPATVVATDDCDPNVTVIMNEIRIDGPCSDNYTLMREWIATDVCGNMVAATQNITVEDNSTPWLTNVPPDMTVQCDQIPVAETVVATDNCDTNVEIIFNESMIQGSCIDSYTLMREWTATDNCGNMEMVTQYITVEDYTTPIFTNFPADITINCDSTPPPPAQVLANDNCATNVTIEFNETADGNCPDAHSIFRTWTATDNCGNIETMTQVITVDSVLSNTCNMIPSTALVSDYNGFPISCAGATDAAVIALKQGGIAPFTFLWNTSDTTAVVNGLGTGYYYVTITDANNCSVFDSIYVIEPMPINIIPGSVSASTSISTDGMAGAMISGGIAPYTYNWSNGQTADTITNLMFGMYDLTVTDANGCFGVANVYVDTLANNCNNFVASTSITSNYSGYDISCVGSNDGSAMAIASGGIAPYIYNWSTGDSTSSIYNLPAGSYTVSVTDSQQCMTTSVVTLIDPPAIFISTNSVSASTSASTDGMASAMATGGIPPYSYYWSNGQTTDSITNLMFGMYDITVTDANGCFDVANVYVDTIAANCNSLNAVMNVIDVNCFAGMDGMAEAIAMGGSAPYTFIWSNGQTTSMNVGIPAGVYDVTITDANNCSIVNTAFVNEPSQIAIATNSVSASTSSSTDGMASAIVTGGFAPYTYNWSNGQTADSITNLMFGMYDITVTDANGCFDVANVYVDTVVANCNTLNSVINTIDVNCFGGMDGIAEAIATGGSAPYSYAWSNGQTTSINVGIPVGVYDVTITDANNCSIVNTAIVNEPSPIVITSNVIDVSCYNANDGMIEIIATGGNTGGTPPYTYYWDNGQSTGAILLDAFPGTYTVTVTDANGCYETLTATVTEPAPIYTNVYTTPETQTGADGSISTMTTGGQAPYVYNWSNGATTDSLYGLPAGVYDLTITDVMGCQEILMAIVESDTSNNCTSLIVNATVTSNYNGADISCDGNMDGSLYAIAQGGMAPYTYYWSTSDSSNTVNNLGEGVYTVTATDSQGCTAISDVQLIAAEPVSTVVWSMPASSPTAADGFAGAIAYGGTAPYTYDWSNGATTDSITNLMAGTYLLIVTDANGCNN